MAEDTFIDFKCPHCGAPNAFMEVQCGTAQGCPICEETLVVPTDGSAVGGRLPLPVRTARLLLRRFKPDDWNGLLELLADADSCAEVDWPPQDEQQLEAWLEQERALQITQPGGQLYVGLELTETAKLIGFVSLHYRELDHREAGFAVLINAAHRRQGYGTEAVGGVLGFGFKGLGLRRIAVGFDSRNTAAGRMLAKAGLRREGEFVKDRKLKGEWVNTAWYARLQEESPGQ